MKRYITIIICYLSVSCIFVNSYAASNSINPSFKFLLTQYPRNKEIIRPMVPRISAKLALKYYQNGKAIFIAAGPAAIKANLPLAISLLNKYIENPPKGFFKKHKGKLIIIFCH